MDYNDNWSKALQEDSVDVLYNGRCAEPCRVKHFRKEDRFGSVSIIDGITKGIWKVITDNGNEEEFSLVEDLVKSGWVVD